MYITIVQIEIKVGKRRGQIEKEILKLHFKHKQD